MSNFMSDSDALQVFGTYAEDIKKGKGVIAVRETSPATAAHSVGEYVRYNGTTYKVKSAISIGDSLILNTNIEANGLPEGTTIFTPETVGDPTVAFLDDLGDVDISNPQDGDVPTYNSTTGKFENSNAIDENISAVVNVYGSKNLLKQNLIQTVGSGVTFNTNSDGTITANGTASGDCYYNFSIYLYLKPGEYILSGTPKLANGNYYLYMDSTEGVFVDYYGTGVKFNVESESTYWAVHCWVKDSTSLSNIIFYPMIRDASITDDTYVPYAKTNRELTQEQVKNTDLASIITTGATNTTGAQIPNGAYFYLNGVFCRAIAGIATNAAFTKDTNYVETTIGGEMFPATYESISTGFESGFSGYVGLVNYMGMQLLTIEIVASATCSNTTWKDVLSSTKIKAGRTGYGALANVSTGQVGVYQVYSKNGVPTLRFLVNASSSDMLRGQAINIVTNV